MDTDTIKEILEDDTSLDSIPIEVLEDLYQYLGFYLMDRDPNIEELDFNK